MARGRDGIDLVNSGLGLPDGGLLKALQVATLGAMDELADRMRRWKPVELVSGQLIGSAPGPWAAAE